MEQYNKNSVNEYLQNNNLKNSYVERKKMKNGSSLETSLKPFNNQSDLELSLEEVNIQKKPQIDKKGAICAYFICNLPFSC